MDPMGRFEIQLYPPWNEHNLAPENRPKLPPNPETRKYSNHIHFFRCSAFAVCFREGKLWGCVMTLMLGWNTTYYTVGCTKRCFWWGDSKSVHQRSPLPMSPWDPMGGSPHPWNHRISNRKSWWTFFIKFHRKKESNKKQIMPLSTPYLHP